MDLCSLFLEYFRHYRFQPMFYFIQVNPMPQFIGSISNPVMLLRRLLSFKLSDLPLLSILRTNPSSFLGFHCQPFESFIALLQSDHYRHSYCQIVLLLKIACHLLRQIYLLQSHRFEAYQLQQIHLHHRYYRNLIHHHFDFIVDQSLQTRPYLFKLFY